jgi:hypothetical protein
LTVVQVAEGPGALRGITPSRNVPFATRFSNPYGIAASARRKLSNTMPKIPRIRHDGSERISILVLDLNNTLPQLTEHVQLGLETQFALLRIMRFRKSADMPMGCR